MKAILVIDVNMTQDNKHICKDDESKCPLFYEEIPFCMYNIINNTKGCPLKPIPNKRKMPITKTFGTDFNKGQVVGWNACIDEILGDTE